MEEESFGSFDENDVQFISSLGQLIESRITQYAAIKYPECDDEQNYLIALLAENMTVAMAGYYSCGYPNNEERHEMLDELCDAIQLLKEFDTHQLKKDCNEQKLH
jgi:hypothetical protein